MIKEYLQQRYKVYIQLLLGVLTGFAIAGLLFKNLDYRTVLLVLVIGFCAGELLNVRKWRKQRSSDGIS